jgi:beta-phosphoglucomutase
MTLKAAIFDMDGVVVDTVPIHFHAWKRMFGEYGHDFTFEDYKEKVDGIPRHDGTRAILTELSDEEIIEAGDRKQSYFLEEIHKSEIPIYQSTIDLIDDLQGQNIKVAVISASKNAPLILERINLIDRLDSVVCGHDVERGKPDPEVFLVAAKRLHVNQDECIVFEDAALGVEAAKKASMLCVGIDRYGDPTRLEQADIVVTDLSEVDFDKLLNLFLQI